MKRRIIAWIATLCTVLCLLPLAAKATENSAEVPAKPYKIANVVSGVHVYWKAADGAVKYGVWRSETGVNGTYKWLANPTVPHFTDTAVESGKTYYYRVTAMDSAGNHSAKSEALGITFVSTPDITTRFNKAAGITLGWEKIEGATGYAIYRKSYSGTDAWARVATVEGNSAFTWQDTSVKDNNGTAYKYTIRALAGSNMKTLSGCRNAGRTMVRLTSRTLSSAEKASDTSVKCSWTTSKAVTGYEVRFVVDGSVYKTVTVGNYATGTRTFTDLEAGRTYQIQVRSYKTVSGVGSFYSAWSEAKYVELAAPVTHVCSYTATKRMSDVVADLYEKKPDGYTDYIKYSNYYDWDVDFCEGCGFPDMDTFRFAYTPEEAAEIMLGYVNDLREEVFGTDAYNLILDDWLTDLAEIRAEEISVNFSHGGTYTGCAECITNAGPNIYDQFIAWKESTKHYEIMVTAKYRDFGYAIYQSDTGVVFGVQLYF